MSDWGFKPYVPVAKRRADAAKQVKQLAKGGRVVAPVVIEGRRIAASFWGKAWCDNLERYSDYANRLPRGRTYVRNGSVIDLSIAKGRVDALVSGSQIYKVRIDIGVATAQCWRSICADCTGSIGSIVELLQGKLSKQVMERVCRQNEGLFPGPAEIAMDCSCPDWAGMCKHVAAVLYGIGARFDDDPDALFLLRGVDRNELIALDVDPSMTETAATHERVLADDDMAALFGIEMDAPLPTAVIVQGQNDVPKAAPEKRPTRKLGTTKAAREPANDVKPPRQTAKPQSQKCDALPTLPHQGGGSAQSLGSPQIATSPAQDRGEPKQATVDTQKMVHRSKPREVAAQPGRPPIRLSARRKLAEASRSERRRKPR